MQLPLWKGVVLISKAWHTVLSFASAPAKAVSPFTPLESIYCAFTWCIQFSTILTRGCTGHLLQITCAVNDYVCLREAQVFAWWHLWVESSASPVSTCFDLDKMVFPTLHHLMSQWLPKCCYRFKYWFLLSKKQCLPSKERVSYSGTSMRICTA